MGRETSGLGFAASRACGPPRACSCAEPGFGFPPAAASGMLLTDFSEARATRALAAEARSVLRHPLAAQRRRLARSSPWFEALISRMPVRSGPFSRLHAD